MRACRAIAAHPSSSAMRPASRKVRRRSSMPVRTFIVTGTSPAARTAPATTDRSSRGRAGSAAPPPCRVTLRTGQPKFRSMCSRAVRRRRGAGRPRRSCPGRSRTAGRCAATRRHRTGSGSRDRSWPSTRPRAETISLTYSPAPWARQTARNGPFVTPAIGASTTGGHDGDRADPQRSGPVPMCAGRAARPASSVLMSPAGLADPAAGANSGMGGTGEPHVRLGLVLRAGQGRQRSRARPVGRLTEGSVRGLRGVRPGAAGGPSHLSRPLRTAASRPGIGRDGGQRRRAHHGRQGHGARLQRVQRAGAGTADRSPGDRPDPLLDHRLEHLAQRAAGVPRAPATVASPSVTTAI